MSKCPNGKYADALKGQCLACSKTCQTCSGNSNKCTTCATGKYLEADTCKTCVLGNCENCYAKDKCTTCTKGFFLTAGKQCQKCKDKCSHCTSATNCLDCHGAKFLDGHDCVDDCPSGKWKNKGSKTCDACKVPCKDCGASATDCTACNVGQYLKSGTCFKCVMTNCNDC